MKTNDVPLKPVTWLQAFGLVIAGGAYLVIGELPRVGPMVNVLGLVGWCFAFHYYRRYRAELSHNQEPPVIG